MSLIKALQLLLLLLMLLNLGDLHVTLTVNCSPSKIMITN